MALALSLADAGIEDVHVYESAGELKELGVGINVLPHAVRELTELGLLDELSAVAIPTAELVYYSKHGQRIWGEARGLAAGYKWPQFSIHRGELLGILSRAVLKRLGPERIHPCCHLSAFGQDRNQAWAEFVDKKRAHPVVVPKPTYWWAAMASIPSCAGRFFRMKVRRNGMASRCGVG